MKKINKIITTLTTLRNYFIVVRKKTLTKDNICRKLHFEIQGLITVEDVPLL